MVGVLRVGAELGGRQEGLTGRQYLQSRPGFEQLVSVLLGSQCPLPSDIGLIDLRIIADGYLLRVQLFQHRGFDWARYQVHFNRFVQQHRAGRGHHILQKLIDQVNVRERCIRVLAAQLDLTEIGATFE